MKTRVRNESGIRKEETSARARGQMGACAAPAAAIKQQAGGVIKGESRFASASDTRRCSARRDASREHQPTKEKPPTWRPRNIRHT